MSSSKPVLLLFMLLALRFTCYADEGVGEMERRIPDWRIALNLHSGFVVKHNDDMRILAEQPSRGAELYLIKRTRGEKSWHSFFNYPEYGASVMIIDPGSPTYLGKIYGLYPFMNFYLRDNHKYLNYSIKVGGGAAYVEKIYDPYTNPENLAISTHINALLNLQFNANVRITDKIPAFAGIGLTHFSNGTFKKPNAGVNIITMNVGVGYVFNSNYPLKPAVAVEVIDKKWEYRLYMSGGIKEIHPIGGKKYVASGISLELSRRHRSFTRFGGTLDLFYDSSDYVYLSRNAESEITRLQTVKTGLAAGYELVFGKLSTTLQTGFYPYVKNTRYGRTYQRLALRYAVTPKVNLHFGLKSHLSQADYIELAYGYKIR